MVDSAQREIVHGTVYVERRVAATPRQAFQAFADAGLREEWGAPTSTAAFIVEEADFREGGTERVRCGDAADPRIIARSHYHRIVPNETIVFTEQVENDGDLVMVSLQTIAFEPDADQTLVRVLVQLTSLVGEEMIKNTEHGYNGSMDSLKNFLDNGAR